jgi:SAM-dependent methyltransferase
MKAFHRHMVSQQPATQVAAELEYPSCPLCASDRRRLRFCLSKVYHIARCLACGVHYLYPRQRETCAHELYRDLSYFEGGVSGYADASYLAQEESLRATFKRLLHNLAKRDLLGGDLLEIGCGYGYLLDEARSLFRRRVGTEFSAEGAEIARGTGAEVFVGGVEQLARDERFDCVIATQVIEHVYEPLVFVKRLTIHMKPNAHIVLATPDIGGVLRKLMGRRWPSFKVPEHVVYFDFRTLELLMRRAGLESIRRLPYPHAFPLSLITAKFGLSLPHRLGRLKIWVAATTVAAYGSVRNG